MAPDLEGKSMGSDLKTVLKESSWFGEPRIRLEAKVQSNSKLLLQNTFFFHKINAARSDSTFYPLPKNVRFLGNDVELIFSGFLGVWWCLYHVLISLLYTVAASLTDIMTRTSTCLIVYCRFELVHPQPFLGPLPMFITSPHRYIEC
jgi:hypothetical protein